MKSILKRFLLLFAIGNLIIATLGCDAFVRKFTRKQKKETTAREDLVLVPEEYKPTMDKEQLYRQYFLFWQSWQNELIQSLTPMQNTNNKKQIDCAQEAIKNLSNLRAMINEGKQKKLDIYINELKELKERIANDFYGTNIPANSRTAERIKRGILRDFSYSKVKKDLV